MLSYFLRSALLFILSFWLLPGDSYAQPAFFKLTKDDTTHWLLGSIHAANRALYPLPESIEESWRASNALVLEVAISDITPAQWQESRQLTHLAAGQHLKDLLSTELYQRTLLAGARYGIEESALQSLKPWFAAITLTQAAMEQSQVNSRFGIEYYFTQQAIALNKPLLGLETMWQQMNYLASVEPQQIAMLESALDELGNVEQHLLQILTAWQQGNEAALITLLKTEMAPAPLQQWLEETLLAKRNHNWLKKWPTLPNNSFIVVGALHLYQEHGLLALLANQGWQITPLTTPVKESKSK